MRILVSGAGGLVGKALVAALRERGDEVGALVRGGGAPGPLDVAWDPSSGAVDQGALEDGDFDVVVTLAGEPLLGKWNDEKKQRIRDSRVNGTRGLAEALAKLERRPSTFVCASAVGIYGDRGDELLTEQSTAGTGFLADVVTAWEAAADPARDAGIRTVHMRMGVVQAADGGALKEQLLPFKLGLGGPVGSGKQWVPWVSLTELVAMYLFAIDTDSIDGPVDAVGPTPARNKEYAKSITRALHRPMIFGVPAFAARAMFGEVADALLLASQKVLPARLEAAGYEFLDRTVFEAVERELAKR